jgi:hypothetical protein
MATHAHDWEASKDIKISIRTADAQFSVAKKIIHAVGYPPVREKGFMRFFSPTVAPTPPKIIHHNTSMIRCNFYLQDLDTLIPRYVCVGVLPFVEP